MKADKSGTYKITARVNLTAKYEQVIAGGNKLGASGTARFDVGNQISEQIEMEVFTIQFYDPSEQTRKVIDNVVIGATNVTLQQGVETKVGMVTIGGNYIERGAHSFEEFVEFAIESIELLAE